MTRATRDQQRALHAYRCVDRVPEGARADYKTHVNSLGSAVLRSGLAAALAFLQRDREQEAVKLLLEHLASARMPGVPLVKGDAFPGEVRALALGDYMLVTREVLQLVVWLRRAVQATFGTKEATHVARGA
ncbi:type III-B CRISPR module-associated protein Cmr5 [Pyxidicoccus sp. 3LFB2]